jgi:hypothetical protein
MSVPIRTTIRTTITPHGHKIIETSSYVDEFQPDELNYSFEFYDQQAKLIFSFSLVVQQILTNHMLKKIFSTINYHLDNFPGFNGSFSCDGFGFAIKMDDSSLFWMVSSHFDKFLETELTNQPHQKVHKRKHNKHQSHQQNPLEEGEWTKFVEKICSFTQ